MNPEDEHYKAASVIFGVLLLHTTVAKTIALMLEYETLEVFYIIAKMRTAGLIRRGSGHQLHITDWFHEKEGYVSFMLDLMCVTGELSNEYMRGVQDELDGLVTNC